LFAVLLLVGASSPVFGQPVSATFTQNRIQAACLFLENLYSPSLGLVRSSPTSTVYYIASDNILAAKALAECNTTQSQRISQNITSTISRCCGTGYDHKHEILLGARIQLPIHDPHIYTVANTTSYSILWEVDNATTISPDCTYADIAVYTALELNLEKNVTGTQHEMDCLNIMYDGHGLADEPYKDGSVSEHGIYQTYKLAFYMLALHIISNTHNYGDMDILLRMQGPEGGFHTGYDTTGTYHGTLENTETTSIAIITLTALNTYPFSIPWWAVYVFIGLVAAAASAVVLVLLLERKRHPS
jgi:hypothetical protein